MNWVASCTVADVVPVFNKKGCCPPHTTPTPPVNADMAGGGGGSRTHEITSVKFISPYTK